MSVFEAAASDIHTICIEFQKSCWLPDAANTASQATNKILYS